MSLDRSLTKEERQSIRELSDPILNDKYFEFIYGDVLPVLIKGLFLDQSQQQELEGLITTVQNALLNPPHTNANLNLITVLFDLVDLSFALANDDVGDVQTLSNKRDFISWVPLITRAVLDYLSDADFYASDREEEDKERAAYFSY